MPKQRSNLSKRVGKDKQTSLKVTEGSELMKFLLAQLPGKGRNQIKLLLAHRQISVDHEVITQFNYPLKAGQQVMVNWTKVQGESGLQAIKILFEDQYLIVIEKQTGLLSIATTKEKDQTAYSILSRHVKKENPKNRIFVVHRLDKDTSGVMMFAKNQDVQQMLQKSWKEIVIERSYVVVVEGAVIKEQDTITSWLKESKTLIMYSSPVPNEGQKAVTHYQVLQKNNNFSLLKVELETGRKNQIRVHMQDLGHSVAGDKKYGATKNPINRLALHAQVLTFRHPVNGQEMHFETTIPKQFLTLFNS